jgi:hypothetical protein
MTFLLLAALSGLFAVLVAIDAINFETDRIDRWTMIFGFAGVAFFLGLASADSSGSSTSEPTSRRGAAEQALQDHRLDPSTLPARPGSLLRTAVTSETVDDATPEEPALDLIALETDPVETELQEIIDEDQMNEIAALVEESEAEPVDAGIVTDGAADQTVITADETDPAIQPLPRPASADITSAEPIARVELRLADYDDEALQKLVKDSEALVIAEMVRTGQLTSAGELTESDIASMVFLAYTSDEMLAELRLRKSLDQPGDVALTDRALAPLKNIE